MTPNNNVARSAVYLGVLVVFGMLLVTILALMDARSARRLADEYRTDKVDCLQRTADAFIYPRPNLPTKWVKIKADEGDDPHDVYYPSEGSVILLLEDRAIWQGEIEVANVDMDGLMVQALNPNVKDGEQAVFDGEVGDRLKIFQIDTDEFGDVQIVWGIIQARTGDGAVVDYGSPLQHFEY